MKFNFKIQQYQTDAVEAVVRVFNGQGRNEALELTDEQLLQNIHELQALNNIKLSPALVKDIGGVSLDVDMETGTGKTYVYIKTMFELNKRYGWSKFIVVVPSIAIREGVKKSFEVTRDHFMEHYRKKARFFIYNSSNLHQLDEFSSGSGIHVMIINTQAFASSLKEDGRSKEARIIYSKRDEFGSRRPIDVIAANRPIIIRDEPQKMGGEVTQKALQSFNPLFTLNYSATHAEQHNLVYVLDALDAYNKRLVKKIEVKGFEVRNFRGTDQYLYLESILLSSKKPPMARLELEISYNKSINRETRILGVGDNIYYISNEMEQYKHGYIISEVDPIGGTVTFSNGIVMATGDVVGDVSEQDMRRIQIRETIISHFEKEEKLFDMGIKALSLFFIDEVAKYRLYDENGDEQLGEYGRMFEQEYNSIANQYITLFDTPYQKYLKAIDTTATHRGYFSIDKKTGKTVNSKLKRGSEFSDDTSAYDLILKHKERLLSFEENTRFIFSHSALREGWDNPNVFQICTLKHSDSTTMKRQEVGRGLRLSVNQSGTRMDAESCGDAVHAINMLTVIASESYASFVGDLQKQIKGVKIENGNRTKLEENRLNDNFHKKEFQSLWNHINHKYAYTVEFDSEELIGNSIAHINENLFVSQLQYTTTKASQQDTLTADMVAQQQSFYGLKSRTATLNHTGANQIKYDLIGKIAEGTTLTRRTAAAILKGMNEMKLHMFRNNPEEFISKVIRLINEQKATMIVEHIAYDRIEDEYESSIFTTAKHSQALDKAFPAEKHIQDYVFTDGTAELSVERRFAQDLDAAAEVCVYAKLPRGFAIPTPVGNYSPDWAIAFNEGEVKHIYFIAETKGSMDSLNLRPIEKAKISCAKKLFNELTTNKVKYHEVDSYQSLLNLMRTLQ